MPFAVLSLEYPVAGFSSHNGGLLKFGLNSSKNLKDEIEEAMHETYSDLIVEWDCHACRLLSGHIDLHNLLEWIEDSGWRLDYVTMGGGGELGTPVAQCYVFRSVDAGEDDGMDGGAEDGSAAEVKSED